jgi:hypothetical protein
MLARRSPPPPPQIGQAIGGAKGKVLGHVIGALPTLAGCGIAVAELAKVGNASTELFVADMGHIT